MQANTTIPNYRQSPRTETQSNVHADLYYLDEKMVAAVLWRGMEDEPFLCLQDSHEGGIQTFTLLPDGDIPRFDRHQLITELDATVLCNKSTGPGGGQIEEVVGVSLTKPGEASPCMVISGDCPQVAPARAPYDKDDMDAAVAYTKQTQQLFREGKHAEAFAHYQCDPLGGATEGGIATQERFITTMYSMRDVQGEPLFPQPEGYSHGDLTVGMKVQLEEDGKWQRVRHIIEFNGHGSYVMLDGSPILHKDADLFGMYNEPNAQQYDAVIAFSKKYVDMDRDWKEELSEVWFKGDYSKRGIDADQAALLQQVRNQCGPEWLANTKLDLKPEMLKEVDAEAQYRVSIHSESWDEDAREAGEPAERGIEIDRETLALDELVLEARIYGIDSVSSPTLADPYVWFKSSSPTEDAEHFEDGIDKYFSLHIHEVDGKEPTTDHYAALAQKFGIKLALRNEATADTDNAL